MALTLRVPGPSQCDALTALCLRSKAHWGYDAAFMAACTDELTIRPEHLATCNPIVLEERGTLVGTAQVADMGDFAELNKFFVDPDHMGRGHGRRLFNWAVQAARATPAAYLNIEADPQAAPFYERMGATRAGTVPSDSIPGRVLPVLRFDLKERAVAQL